MYEWEVDLYLLPIFWCAQHGRNLTGESPECGLIVPST